MRSGVGLLCRPANLMLMSFTFEQKAEALSPPPPPPHAVAVSVQAHARAMATGWSLRRRPACMRRTPCLRAARVSRMDPPPLPSPSRTVREVGPEHSDTGLAAGSRHIPSAGYLLGLPRNNAENGLPPSARSL